MEFETLNISGSLRSVATVPRTVVRKKVFDSNMYASQNKVDMVAT